MKEIMNKITFILIAFLMAACGSSQKAQGQNGVNKKARASFNKAITAFQYGEYEEAEKLFKLTIKKYNGYVDAYDGLAKTYQEQKKYKEAIATYRKVLEFDPTHYFALYELGKLYQGTENLDSAKYFFKFFLKENAGQDENTEIAQQSLLNIEFSETAMKNPVDINPVSIGSAINTQLEEYSPAFAIDENTIYFTNRDPKYQNEDIFYSTKENGVWQTAKNIGSPINTVDNEGAFSISSDGNYIFFTSCSRSGGKGQCDIWLTMNKNGTWTTPSNLQEPINSRYWESQPSISSNGRQLYFTSDRPGGFGGTDLWVATFGDEGWEEPVNLGPDINTSKDEQFPFIHSDGVTLYFSSEGHPGMGGSDLYISHLKPDNSWEEPKNLGYPINTSGEDWNMIVGRDGETAYYSSNSIPGGSGGMDIYTFKLPKEIQAQKVSYARGTIRDAKTKKPLGAGVTLSPLDNSTPTFTYAPDGTGVFIVALVANMRYALTIDKPGYLLHSEHFDMPNVETDKPFELVIDLQKIEVGKSIVLKNIFFDTDKFELKSDSENELAKLIEFLKNNPERKIEISGHTDNVGSAEHNRVLSENRAKSVYNYLIEKGIDQDKLTYKGYGDTQPITSNETDKGKAQNRRTEFKIIN